MSYSTREIEQGLIIMDGPDIPGHSLWTESPVRLEGEGTKESPYIFPDSSQYSTSMPALGREVWRAAYAERVPKFLSFPGRQTIRIEPDGQAFEDDEFHSGDKHKLSYIRAGIAYATAQIVQATLDATERQSITSNNKDQR